MKWIDNKKHCETIKLGFEIIALMEFVRTDRRKIICGVLIFIFIFED